MIYDNFLLLASLLLTFLSLGFTLHDFHHHHHHHDHDHGDYKPIDVRGSEDQVLVKDCDDGASLKSGATNSPHCHDEDDHHHHNHHHENINIRAAIIHIIGDLISSIGVVIASIFIMVEDYRLKGQEGDGKFVNKFLIVDPICTFVFSVIVLFTTIPLIRDCIMTLMEATPRNVHIDKIEVSVLYVCRAIQ
jgi:zinc transporter 2